MKTPSTYFFESLGQTSLVLCAWICILSISKEAKAQNQICYNNHCFPAVNYDPSAIPAIERYGDPFTAKDFPRSQNPNQYLPPKRLLQLSSVPENAPISRFFDVSEWFNRRYKTVMFSAPVLKLIDQMFSGISSKIQLNSSYRSPAYNATLPGSARWSRHLYGDAVDFMVAGAQVASLKPYCEKMGASFIQLYANHIHCDWRGHPLDPQFYDHQSAVQSPDEVAALMSENSQIEMVDQNQNYLSLIVLHPQQEDEGDLDYRWDVQYQNGRTLTLHTPQITIPRVKGQVIIRVLVGGFFAVSRTYFLQ